MTDNARPIIHIHVQEDDVIMIHRDAKSSAPAPAGDVVLGPPQNKPFNINPDEIRKRLAPDDSMQALRELLEQTEFAPRSLEKDQAIASPVDDEATVGALMEALEGASCDCWETREKCKRAIAKICRGEVPGLPSPDEHASLEITAKRLESERNAASAMVLSAENEAASHRVRAEQLQAEVGRLRSELHAAHRSELVAVKERDATAIKAGDAIDLLKAIRGWDMLDACADGPHWKARIDGLFKKHGKDASK